MGHKFILMTIFIIIAISALGFFANFGHGLIWLSHDKPEDFVALMMRLLFLTLVTERIVEFYKLMHLTKNRNCIRLEIEIARFNESDNNAAKIKGFLVEKEKYHAQTRQKTTLMGFVVGAVMALMGIRVFTGMFDFEDASGIQIVLFDIFEVLVMGALMAGGSKGINTMVSAIESFAKPAKVKQSPP
ncbi:MAG: hypothetical protein V7784_11365 [Oceanospirillaceae bacterium]